MNSKNVTIETENYSATFTDSKELRNKVFERVMGYFKEHEAFNGECIMQCDNPVIDAPSVFAEIADSIIGFDVECK